MVTYLTQEQAQTLLTDLKPGSTIEVRKLPTGEIVVSDPTQTKEDILKEKFACLIGQPITVSDAAEKYGIPRTTIFDWKNKGYVTVLETGYRLTIDEAEMAYCSDIYNRRKASGLGFRGSPLLDEHGLEYELKHENLARYRRKRKTNPQN